ncbi:family 78 glycoside hydrolase catalytic domain [Paenibacillus sp. 2TAB19]|uniref:family 78 glycoside hydrolase catalytic domain n=1 Tax=Paenibacillus sp. 2TAB19 TaxID=3233003 RepID=UPI003F9AB7D3
MILSNLLVQYLKNPIGLESMNPLLSYTLTSDVSHQAQTAYRILAASTQEHLRQEIGDVWDSGKVFDSRPFAIEYAGKQLRSRQRVFWTVKVWDKEDIESEWSEIAVWEMGLLNESDWTANWIGHGDGMNANPSAAPQVAYDFELKSERKIAHARAYISGLGLFHATLNGQRLDDAFFHPGESDYSQTVYYETFDVTNMLRRDSNAIGIVIGNGQYVNFKVNPVMTLEDGTEAPEHRYQKNDSGYTREGIYGEKKVLAQVEVTYDDGEVEIVAATDETWKLTDSPITFNNWYGGEDYDATVELDGWDLPGMDRTGWNDAAIMKKPLGTLRGREFLPIRMIEKFPAASVTKLDNGNWLVDMGRNVAGFPELVLRGTTAGDHGTVISMYPAEMLNAEGTGVDQASCTQSESKKYNCSITNRYTVKGVGDEAWHPIFCYQGFQFVEVSGFPGEATVDNFNCCVLRAANEKTGTFETSDSVLNRVHELTERSIESNMYFSFTDCPQIEKLGWLETSHLMFRSITSGYDIRSWIPKITQDMIDAQTTEEDNRNGDPEGKGYVPAIAPEYYRIVGLHRDPNWGGACILTPWEYYQIYGDITLLRRAYETMTTYLDYLETHTQDSLLIGYAQMGDWGQLNESTPTVLVENCAYYYMLSIMVRIAELTGHHEDTVIYRLKAEEVQRKFHNHADCYEPESRRYGNDSQASYGCVLFSGIGWKENIDLAVTFLKDAVRRRDDHLSSGEVGLKQVFATLGCYGASDVVYRMVTNDTQPSYKYFVDNGLTTLPEYWNYQELWHGTMVRSRNHAMMGHVKEWLTSYVLGIRPEEPGYRKLIIEPSLTDLIETVRGSIWSPYGLIRVECVRNDAGITLDVEIPVGATAEIRLKSIPAEHSTIGSGKFRFSINTDGVGSLK